ncbi:hypothetical protein AT728_12700 [Streptomyces silvensis]|uniref:Uncharacterized protein n=1 Tax=Streptomyces silvensis TaxID=1765722 RepID=A0A0W7X188_9ACTN|nr:hypothetical protein AT728_12700 [Streptomyces silvensis]
MGTGVPGAAPFAAELFAAASLAVASFAVAPVTGGADVPVARVSAPSPPSRSGSGSGPMHPPPTKSRTESRTESALRPVAESRTGSRTRGYGPAAEQAVAGVGSAVPLVPGDLRDPGHTAAAAAEHSGPGRCRRGTGAMMSPP